MKSTLQRIILISLLLALITPELAFAETKAVSQPDALDAYSKAIELSPKDAMVYYNRGNANSKLGNYKQAVDDFDKAIALSPQNAAAYYNRGFAHSKLGNYKQAVDDFDKTIELNPQNAAAYYNRGFAYNNLGNYTRAISDYDRAIELSPNDAAVYCNRGVAYSRLDHTEQAISDFDKAIELSPQYAVAYNHRGTGYKKLGIYKQAISDFDKAIDLSPQYAEAYNNRGAVYNTFGNHKQAIDDFNKAIELYPQYAMAYNNRGFTYHTLGNHSQAVADYDKAIELDPKFAIAYNNRGAVYDGLGNYKQAIADYDKAIELNRQHTTVSGISSGQSDWIAGYGNVIEENKSRGVVVIIAILVAGSVLFILKSRKKSFANMQDNEMITLIKEAAQEGQFDRILRKEMEYIYRRGFALATHRLDDDDLIKAVNQFKAEIEKRKEAPSPQLPSGEKTALSSRVEEPHEVDENLYEAILGERNCIYYLTKFKYFDWQPIDLKESWNWAAFFGSGIWGLYRKMYGWFFAFLGIAALSAACVMKGEYALCLIVFIVPWVAFAVYANSLYHNRMKKIIAAAQLSITDKSKLIEYLRYEGGVNAWVVWVCILLPVAGILSTIMFYMARR
jgi:tetratricopeptide (TPR) repeat protein